MTAERWSGYATQTEPWRNGYDWAYSRGEHGKLNSTEALEAYGYDFGTSEDREFMQGIDFAQNEQMRDLGK